MKHPAKNLWTLGLCLLGWAATAAGEADTDTSKGTENAIEEVVVTAHPLSADGLAQPTDTLAGEELAWSMADSIGATLANKPGIHSASFGPAVGRPVIHGLDGVRVRIMEDHIDVMDVSATSGDHAATIDPFTADSIDILKGASTLLYGSGAIGGVIDVHTGRIPHKVPERLTGKLDLRAADNGNATRGALRLDGGAGGFAWHLDGALRDADDVEIPGFAESAQWRALEEEEAHEEHGDHHDEEDENGHAEDEAGEARGLLMNSALEAKNGAFGFSFIGERGFVGLSVSRFETEYGLPGHAHGHGDEHHDEEEHEHEEGEGHDEDEDHDEHEDHDEDEDHDEHEDHDEDEGHDEEDHQEGEGEDAHGHEEEGSPYLDLKQTRIDVEAGLTDPLPGFRSFNLRFGVNDYEHLELEEVGEIGTRFTNEAWEARAELSHHALAGWRGTLGVQLSDQDYAAYGDEAYVPPVETAAFGLFWVGERHFDRWQLEAGLRFDRVKHDPTTGENRKFSGASASLGAVVPLGQGWRATVLADYAQRAPSAQELYSNGPHFATNSFDVGDPTFDKEAAFNLSATLGYKDERWSALATAYYTRFQDFIYQADSNELADGLPVRHYRQNDATFAGLEAEASLVAATWETGLLTFNAFFDSVSAEIETDNGDNPPRLPPDRLGLGADLRHGSFSAALNYARIFKQTETAAYELPTEGYDDLTARLAWSIETQGAAISLFVQGRNLTDAEQRRHTSYVKELVPEPGRTIEGGVRIQF